MLVKSKAGRRRISLISTNKRGLHCNGVVNICQRGEYKMTGGVVVLLEITKAHGLTATVVTAPYHIRLL
jgi:hypothetical protein